MRAPLSFIAAIVLVAGVSSAQQPAYPPPPAPGAYPQPPAYGAYPQPPAYGAYPQPPAYGAYQQPPAGYTYPPASPPRTLPYHEGPLPFGYHLEEHFRKGLIVSGSVVFGVPYFFSLTTAASSSNSADRYLLLPAAGPFVDLSARSRHCSSGLDCLGEGALQFLLAMDGVVQTGGTLLLLFGFAFPKRELVSDASYALSKSASHHAWWTIAPAVLPGSTAGVVAAGEIF